MSKAGDPGEKTVRDCILCGRCLEVCPLFLATNQEEFSPKAKHYLRQCLEKGELDLAEKPARELAELCLGCGRCVAACPQELDGAGLVANLRHAHPGWQEWLWGVWMKRGGVLWPAMDAMAALADLVPKGLRHGPFKTPKMLKPLQRRSPRPAWLAVDSFDTSARGGKALLYPGCTATRLEKAWTPTAKKVLAGLGYELIPDPGWTCCGSSCGHAGLRRAQAEMRGQNLKAWRRAGRPMVVTFCATCQAGLRDYADDGSLGWEQGEAQAWAKALTPLGKLWGETRFALLSGAPMRIGYHHPCHQEPPDPDQAWLKRALGDRLAPVSEKNCCGLGGVMRLGAPELCGRVARACWQALAPDSERPDASVQAVTWVLTGCSGCVLQLSATAPAGAVAAHWLEALVL